MNFFDIAYEQTMGHEGGYVYDPTDAGGETYKGISRKFNKSWEGWKIIDMNKDHPQFPGILAENSFFQMCIKDFYRAEYWDKFRGDDIPNKEIAIEMFDTAVNMGVSRSVTFLQQALNCLNRNEKIHKDLVEDGAIGNKSIAALVQHLKIERGNSNYLYKVINILQGNHYLSYMRKSPKQEKYARGWLNRVTFNK